MGIRREGRRDLGGEISGHLAKTLCSKNLYKSMIEIVRSTRHNVKRWRDGDMDKRRTAAGLLAAEQ